MANEEKVKELGIKYARQYHYNVYPEYSNDSYFVYSNEEIETACQEMAEWKDEQMMELWNVARNVYEAWMGGTMNDVKECMKDLGHVYDEFKDKGMY